MLRTRYGQCFCEGSVYGSGFCDRLVISRILNVASRCSIASPFDVVADELEELKVMED